MTRFYRSSGSHSLWPGPEGVLSERPAKASFSPNRSAQSLTALHRGLRPAPNYQSPAQEVGEASSDSFGSSATFSQLATLLLSRNRRRERSLLALSTLKADDFPSKPLQDFRPLRSDTLDLEEVFRASLEPSRSSPAAHRPSKVAISRWIFRKIAKGVRPTSKARYRSSSAFQCTKFAAERLRSAEKTTGTVRKPSASLLSSCGAWKLEIFSCFALRAPCFGIDSQQQQQFLCTFKLALADTEDIQTLSKPRRGSDRVFRGISLTVPSSHPNPLGWRHRTTTLKRPSLRPTSIAY